MPTSLAVGMRRRGIDVTTSAESGLAGPDDAAQLSFAHSSGRVVVTHDSDFLRLRADGMAHSGIAYCRQGSVPIGEMLRYLVLMHDVLTPEELAGRLEFL